MSNDTDNLSMQPVDDAGTTSTRGQFLVYSAENGQMKIDVRLEDESVWLTQQHLSDLFQVGVPTINYHLKEIYESGELTPEATIRNFRIVRQEGSRQVARSLEFYNLDAIISVGYRVKSAVATRFRIWATQKLREYIVKGFVLDDERLKNPDQLHWAITGQTAAEIIHARADAAKPNMGLTNWRGAKVRKDDVAIAKNYLDAGELAALNNLVEQYLVFAEGQAMRRVPMHMRDWITKLHAFLTINDRDILGHAGKISHQMATELAESEYDKFNRRRIAETDAAGNDFDQAVKQLPPPPKQKKQGGGK